MPTTLKSETARTNGAKSTGPSTPEGKTKASKNSLKHGLHSKQILLPTESAEEFHSLRDSYFDQFEPATQVEAELVETLAALRWRLRRLATIEANIFQNQILEKSELYMDDKLANVDDEGRIAWAFKSLAGSTPALQLLIRYEATLSRSYDRTFKQLQILQTQRPTKQPNEPKPDPPKQQPTVPSPPQPPHETPIQESSPSASPLNDPCYDE